MTEVIKVLGWESEYSIERRRSAGAERDLDLLRKAVLTLQESGEPEEDENLKSSSSKSGQSTSKADKKDKKEANKKDKKEDTPNRSHLSVDEESFIEEVF
jgi:hypothetical protein